MHKIPGKKGTTLDLLAQIHRVNHLALHLSHPLGILINRLFEILRDRLLHRFPITRSHVSLTLSRTFFERRYLSHDVSRGLLRKRSRDVIPLDRLKRRRQLADGFDEKREGLVDG